MSGGSRARPQVPEKIIARLRAICAELPEVREEQAWVGTRWCVRGKNFAHVLMIDQGWPPAYAKAAQTDGPACVLTFRSWGPAAAQPDFARAPYFLPGWWPDIVGQVLGGGVDWRRVATLIAVSYRVLAPQKLAAQVTAPRLPGRPSLLS